jgi:hypothetical protein
MTFALSLRALRFAQDKLRLTIRPEVIARAKPVAISDLASDSSPAYRRQAMTTFFLTR